MTNPSITHAIEVSESAEGVGLRKLVRPQLPEHAAGKRRKAIGKSAPLLAHHGLVANGQGQGGGNAELFYLQKQMQAQTAMVFVLDDGERIEGIIEWYDLHVIKVRHLTRTLIYKSNIKYLYKALEVSAHGSVST